MRGQIYSLRLYIGAVFLLSLEQYNVRSKLANTSDIIPDSFLYNEVSLQLIVGNSSLKLNKISNVGVYRCLTVYNIS